MNYNNWEKIIERKSKNLRLIREYNVWNDANNVHEAFEKLIEKFRDSIILISHRSRGLPSNEDIIKMLRQYKDNGKHDL